MSSFVCGALPLEEVKAGLRGRDVNLWRIALYLDVRYFAVFLISYIVEQVALLFDSLLYKDYET